MRAVDDDRGFALIAALLMLLLMGALAGALTLTTTIETTIAGNYRRVAQERAAAEAVLARALVDLAAAPDWTPALDGAALASFVDGPPSGGRVLRGGLRIDLDALSSLASCRRARPCTASELTRVTDVRPWGADNPVWRPYAYGAADALAGAAGAASGSYVVALIGDDPSEADGDPGVDGGGPEQEGLGRAVLRGYALGPRGDRTVVQVTVVREASGALRVVSWTTQPPGA